MSIFFDSFRYEWWQVWRRSWCGRWRVSGGRRPWPSSPCRPSAGVCARRRFLRGECVILVKDSKYNEKCTIHLWYTKVETWRGGSSGPAQLPVRLPAAGAGGARGQRQQGEHTSQLWQLQQVTTSFCILTVIFDSNICRRHRTCKLQFCKWWNIEICAERAHNHKKIDKLRH